MVFWAAGPLLLAAAAFAPLYNFVLVGVENLLFLLFPTRVMVTTPGDFQAMGRNVLAAIRQGAGSRRRAWSSPPLARVRRVLTCPASTSGRERRAAWLAAAMFAATLVPLMGWAFQAYDVGRDAPP